MKRVTLTLLAALIALAVAARERIAWETRHWPAWWKIALTVVVSAFACATALFSADLLDDFLNIFDIKFPTP